MGSGVERTHSKAAAGGPSEVADCGTGQARLQLADHAAPHLRIDKPGGGGGRWRRERSRPLNTGLQCGEIKPQTSENTRGG